MTELRVESQTSRRSRFGIHALLSIAEAKGLAVGGFVQVLQFPPFPRHLFLLITMKSAIENALSVHSSKQATTLEGKAINGTKNKRQPKTDRDGGGSRLKGRRRKRTKKEKLRSYASWFSKSSLTPRIALAIFGHWSTSRILIGGYFPSSGLNSTSQGARTPYPKIGSSVSFPTHLRKSILLQ